MKRGDVLDFERPVYIRAYATCVGTKEGEGPLGQGFDEVMTDNHYQEKSWEKAESKMIKSASNRALGKAGLVVRELDCALGGDLLNQCIATSFAVRDLDTPFFGLYGACSTMAESMILGGVMVSGGFGSNVLCTASSHFCSAERQYRFPLDYGGQRAQTTQWTATAAGAVILSDSPGKVRVSRACPGRIYDPGVTDAANMGPAMAQSAYETLNTFFQTTKTGPNDYDLIVTGDLATIGKNVVIDLFKRDGIELGDVYQDCGCMLYDESQDAHAGASGCGCSAAVLGAYILPKMEAGELKKVLFCGTGALLSPVSTNQGESVPGICHLVCLEGNV